MEYDKPRLGDIYLMSFSGVGSEQKGVRPGIIFQNDIGNDRSPNVIALPLTTRIKNLAQPTHVLLPAEKYNLLADSLVLCENPQRMSKSRLLKYLGADVYKRQGLQSIRKMSFMTSRTEWLRKRELSDVYKRQHPYPTHTCEKYNVVRERKDYHVRRLPICVKENGGEQKDKKGNE